MEVGEWSSSHEQLTTTIPRDYQVYKRMVVNIKHEKSKGNVLDDE